MVVIYLVNVFLFVFTFVLCIFCPSDGFFFDFSPVLILYGCLPEIRVLFLGVCLIFFSSVPSCPQPPKYVRNCQFYCMPFFKLPIFCPPVFIPFILVFFYVQCVWLFPLISGSDRFLGADYRPVLSSSAWFKGGCACMLFLLPVVSLDSARLCQCFRCFYYYSFTILPCNNPPPLFQSLELPDR